MRRAGLLTFTDETGGQSRRETVVSQTPRTGSLLRADFPGRGSILTGGRGVTSDFGGLDEQLASISAVASSATPVFTILR
jgi:hypothetical protein